MGEDAGARRYDEVADAYRRSRPSYPEPAVTAMLEGLGVGPGSRIVELGAGTGAFASQLSALDFDVVAVEPSARMRAKIVETDNLRTHPGTAENTGLPAAHADAVVAATAWHWFDGPRAIAEVERLLRPGVGGLGLVWNLYDESVPWVAEFADITYRRRPATSPSARDGAWRAPFASLPGWRPLTHVDFANPQPTNPNRLVQRLLSSSVVAELAPDERQTVQDEAWALLRRHDLIERPELELPYTTSVYWTAPVWG